MTNEAINRRPPSEKAGFLRRLAIYLLGVAIGFLILGMFKARSAAEARVREAQRQAAQNAGANER
ncbi:MAG: hypothetical protein U0573_09425 [Phycisphaerales bacterium]|nr:hypothetical protein [Planctomycetota bacterium]